jgi:hypothetical protein
MYPLRNLHAVWNEVLREVDGPFVHDGHAVRAQVVRVHGTLARGNIGELATG